MLSFNCRQLYMYSYAVFLFGCLPLQLTGGLKLHRTGSGSRPEPQRGGAQRDSEGGLGAGPGAGVLLDSDEMGLAEQGPTFRPTPTNITVAPGDRAVLKCRVDHLGTRTLAWKKSDVVHPLTIGLFTFAPDVRITVDYNQRSNEWNLIIQDVRPTDEGVYQCQISSKDEHDTYDIRLNVKNIQITGTDYIERGGVLRLVCNATGNPDPPHDVSWYKDGRIITSDARQGVIITKKIETKVLIGMLVIRDSKLSDAGLYECRSSTLDSSHIKVHVLSVPSAPTSAKKGTMAKMTIGESLFGATSKAVSTLTVLSSISTLVLALLSSTTTWGVASRGLCILR